MLHAKVIDVQFAKRLAIFSEVAYWFVQIHGAILKKCWIGTACKFGSCIFSFSSRFYCSFICCILIFVLLFVLQILLLYKGTLRVLLVLLHDFPEFLCDYHFSFCDVIPPSCIQMRNVILSAFPRNMRLPDPSTPNLKVFATLKTLCLHCYSCILLYVWSIPVFACDIDWSASGDFNSSSNHDWCGWCFEGKANEGSGWWIPKGIWQ